MTVGRIQSVDDLRYEISKADADEDRRTVYTRALYLGLKTKLPRNWNSNGTLKVSDE